MFVHSVPICHVHRQLLTRNDAFGLLRLSMRHFAESKQKLFWEKLDHIRGVLSGMEVYKPYRITDKLMGIECSENTRTEAHGQRWIASRQRRDFLGILSFSEFEIVVYKYIIGGSLPIIVYVFKINTGDDESHIEVKKALDTCIRLSPMHASPRMIKDVRSAIDHSSSRSTMLRDAIVCTVLEELCGKTMSSSMQSRSRDAKQVRDDLTLLISTNQDMRIYNGATGERFSKFFKNVADILQSNGKLEAHSRRKPCSGDEKSGGITYIPPCVPVRNLHEKAKRMCIEDGGTDLDIPCLQTLYLSFVPSNEWAAAAGRYFGRLLIKRGMTKSSGRTAGPDSHYNAKLWKHVMNKLTMLRRIMEDIEESSAEMV